MQYIVYMLLQAQLLNSKLHQDMMEMGQRVQADVSTRIAALHNHISSVSSTQNLAAESVKEKDHVASPKGHLTSSEVTNEDYRAKMVGSLL